MMHRYRANGMALSSEIELPEMMQHDGETQITIRYGDVPDRLTGNVHARALYEAGAGQYLLKIPRVARYWVKDRSTVVIAPETDNVEDIRVFVLSSIMGVLAHYNGFLALHASAIEVDGECVLFAGDSGCGKSTLAAAFHDQGYRIVSDDICAISLDEHGRPLLHAGYRHLKLWGDALDRVGESLGERRRMRVGMPKFSVRVPGSMTEDALPIRRIFALTTELVDEVRLAPIRGRARMLKLRKETYRYRLLRRVGMPNQHFTICNAVARYTPMIEVRRPHSLPLLPRLVRALETEMRAVDATPA